MRCKVFRQRNLGIFAILVLSLSVFSISQTSSQFVSGLSFSDQVNNLEYTTFYAEQQYDSLQISDSVFFVKNNLEIIATTNQNNNKTNSPLANCELVCDIEKTDNDRTRIAKIPRFRCLNTLHRITR